MTAAIITIKRNGVQGKSDRKIVLLELKYTQYNGIISKLGNKKESIFLDVVLDSELSADVISIPLTFGSSSVKYFDIKRGL